MQLQYIQKYDLYFKNCPEREYKKEMIVEIVYLSF